MESKKFSPKEEFIQTQLNLMEKSFGKNIREIITKLILSRLVYDKTVEEIHKIIDEEFQDLEGGLNRYLDKTNPGEAKGAIEFQNILAEMLGMPTLKELQNMMMEKIREEIKEQIFRIGHEYEKTKKEINNI